MNLIPSYPSIHLNPQSCKQSSSREFTFKYISIILNCIKCIYLLLYSSIASIGNYLLLSQLPSKGIRKLLSAQYIKCILPYIYQNTWTSISNICKCQLSEFLFFPHSCPAKVLENCSVPVNLVNQTMVSSFFRFDTFIKTSMQGK